MIGLHHWVRNGGMRPLSVKYLHHYCGKGLAVFVLLMILDGQDAGPLTISFLEKVVAEYYLH
jgi:hypothetical protein